VVSTVMASVVVAQIVFSAINLILIVFASNSFPLEHPILLHRRCSLVLLLHLV
jgi:hypothetical protein